MTINERIQKVQELSGLSITAYAKRLGISQPSLRAIICDGAEPKFGTLQKILADNVNISAEWLIREKGEMMTYADMPKVNGINKEQVDHIKELAKIAAVQVVNDEFEKLWKNTMA